MNAWNISNLEGLIPITGAILLYLIIKGILPVTPRDPEKWNAWREKWEPRLKWLVPFVVLHGVLMLVGVY